MRNNPKFTDKASDHLKLLKFYTKLEKIRRFWVEQKPTFEKEFMAQPF